MQKKIRKEKERRVISLNVALLIYIILLATILALILSYGHAKTEAYNHYKNQLEACENYINNLAGRANINIETEAITWNLKQNLTSD